MPPPHPSMLLSSSANCQNYQYARRPNKQLSITRRNNDDDDSSTQPLDVRMLECSQVVIVLTRVTSKTFTLHAVHLYSHVRSRDLSNTTEFHLVRSSADCTCSTSRSTLSPCSRSLLANASACSVSTGSRLKHTPSTVSVSRHSQGSPTATHQSILQSGRCCAGVAAPVPQFQLLVRSQVQSENKFLPPRPHKKTITQEDLIYAEGRKQGANTKRTHSSHLPHVQLCPTLSELRRHCQ